LNIYQLDQQYMTDKIKPFVFAKT